MTNWDKSKRKYARISSWANDEPSIDCKHNATKQCKAGLLTFNAITDFHHKLYKRKMKAEQDNFFLKFMLTSEHRPRDVNSCRLRLVTNYFI